MGNVIQLLGKTPKRLKRATRPTPKALTSLKRRQQDTSAAYSAITSLASMELDPAEAVQLVEEIDLDEIAPNLDGAVNWLLRFAEEWRRHADRKEKASLAAEGKHLRLAE